MNKRIVVFGTGGIGREIMTELVAVNSISKEYEILGFIDDNEAVKGKEINGFKVIGNSQYLLEENHDICVLVCVGEPDIKKLIIEKLQQNSKIEFPNFFSRGVTFNAENSSIGIGNTVFVNSYFSTNVEIGNFNHINCYSMFGHDVVVGDYNGFSPYSYLSGNVRVGNSCYIGARSTFREGIAIGNDTIIGMGSVVTKSVEANVVAYGSPCEVKRTRNGEKVFGKKR